MSDGTIGMLYVKEFKELKRSAKVSLIVSWVSLIVALVALYLSSVPLWFDDKVSSANIQKCNEIAINLEKMRHPDADAQVTNQDISSYMKNMVACLSDSE